jgi:transcriptional regulator with XRE-family HTH domain
MLGENIKTARLAAALKQAALARQLGISPLRMWRYESNRARPSIEMLRQIAEHIDGALRGLGLPGITVDELINAKAVGAPTSAPEPVQHG